jgi:hypothetical protein
MKELDCHFGQQMGTRFDKIQCFNWFFGFFWLFALVSAVFQPFRNDCLVFWAWAQKVYDSPLSGLDAIESVWEIKGLLSRLIYYHLYAFTRLFTSDLYPYGYIVFTLIGFLEINLILGAATLLVPNQYVNSGKMKLNLYFFLSLAVSTLNRMCNLQPEVWGFAIMLLSFVLYLRGSWLEKVSGGIVLGLVFFLKTPLLLLSGSVFFAALLIEKRNFKEGIKAILPYAVSALVTVVLVLVLIKCAYPQEIQDIADAAYFQPTLIHFGPLKMLRYIGNGVAKFWEMPLNLPILCLGGVSFMLFITNKKLSECLYMMGMWLFPYLYVIVSNCYFIYHFVVFLFAAVLSFYLTKNYWSKMMTKRMLIGLWIIFLIAFGCSFRPAFNIFSRIRNMLFLVPYIVMTFALVEKWRTKVLSCGILFIVFTFVATISSFSYPQRKTKETAKICIEKNKQKGYQLGAELGEGSILQLNNGLGSLWFSNPTYLRYMYPLVIEGRNESSRFEQSNTYVKTKKEIFEYKGEYIVLYSEWFSKRKHDDLRVFIDENYYAIDTVYYSGFYYDLFNYHELKEFGLCILKRKDQNHNTEPDTNSQQ